MLTTSKMKVRSTPVTEINIETMEKMWDLYSSNYQYVTREKFDRDLKSKTEVFVGTDSESGEVCGFSTFEIYEHIFEGKKYGVLYSGDTMIDPRYWGQNGLRTAFLKAVLLWKIKNPRTPLYWLLIVMGYKTYLTMARNSPEYWPRYDRKTPQKIQNLIDSMASKKFGKAWNPQTGLMQPEMCEAVFDHPLAQFTTKTLAIPEVRFLMEKNPTLSIGTEMVCIAPLTFNFISSLLVKWSKRIFPFKRNESSNSLHNESLHGK